MSWQISEEDFFTLETGNGPNEAEEMTDLAESFLGYEDFDFQWYVEQVGRRILNIHQHRGLSNEFVFDLTSGNDGTINGGVVSLSIPQTSLYLTTGVEWKRMTNDREATGRAGLLAIKEALLDFEYANIWRMAETWGLTVKEPLNYKEN